MTVGVVRVVTSTDDDLVEAHGRAISARFGVRTISRCIPDQPTGVHDPDTHARSVPKVVACAGELVAAGADVVVISCAADPGLREARATLEVPVVGAGSAAAALALAVGTRVGVIGITDGAPDPIRATLGPTLLATRRPDGVRDTTDLLDAAGTAAARRTALALVCDGADVLLFACTGLTTIGLGPWARTALDVPVVDAVLAAGAVATHHDPGR